MENPVSFMIRQTGLTRAEFAAAHDFGKNIMTRLIQGRLQSVTPRISAALWSEWESKGLDQDLFDDTYRTLDVDVAYQRWVTNQRLLNRVKIPPRLLSKAGSPFNQFVQSVGSVSKTAQVLCVADVSVQRYADGRIRKMPPAIREALSQMSYPHVEKLEKAQLRWLDKEKADA